MYMKNYENILIKLSKKAYKKNEVPVAALLVNDKGKVISKAYNTREKNYIFFEHAEIKCLTRANKRLKNKFLMDCTLYVTLEPCDMCKVLLKEARIKKVNFMINRNNQKKAYNKTVFENWDCSLENKEIYKNLLSNFFKKRR